MDEETGYQWKLGRVIETNDRTAKIVHNKYKGKDRTPSLKILTRSFRDISLIMSEADVPLNSNEYFARKIEEPSTN